MVKSKARKSMSVEEFNECYADAGMILSLWKEDIRKKAKEEERAEIIRWCETTEGNACCMSWVGTKKENCMRRLYAYLKEKK